MQIDQYLGALGQDAPALADAAEAAGLAAVVPSCPGWTVRDLVGHTGSVHRWATAVVQAEPGSGRIAMPSAPADGLLDWYRQGAVELIEVLTSAPDDLVAWAFLPAASPKAFWARRQAHETAVHRADAELARGVRQSFGTDFAVDGIDELLNGFLARPRTALLADPPVTVLIEAVDADSWWHMTIREDGRDVRSSGSTTADTVLRASASDLYLYLWNRVGSGPVEVIGDPHVAELWREKATV